MGIAVGAILLLGIGGFATVNALGGDDNGGTRGTAATTTTQAATTTAAETEPTAVATTAGQTPTPTVASTTTTTIVITTTVPIPGFQCDDAPECVLIDSLGPVGDSLWIDWTAIGFTPDTNSIHAHFFWGDIDTAQGGTNAADSGVTQGDWELTADQPFMSAAEMLLSQRPVDANEACVTVADGSHAVIDPDVVHCMELPEQIMAFQCGGAPMCARIDSIEISGNSLRIEWDALGFSPRTNNFHAHFYWSDIETAQAGSNASSFGVSSGDWELTDDQPFISSEDMRVSQRPTGAGEVCVTVANGSHGVVDPSVVHCVPYPEA